MGKRSDFPRVEKDYYRTIDPRAVTALVPHLRPGTKFVEPCAGAGDLMDQLEARGHVCQTAFDLDPQRADIALMDALEWSPKRYLEVDEVITNPPWSRPILHSLIDHLSALKPTWLLFDADWAHTRQSEPYMARCVKIVSVGRLIWIPGTTMSGKDNCAWYLFDARHSGPTQFYGRI